MKHKKKLIAGICISVFACVIIFLALKFNNSDNENLTSNTEASSSSLQNEDEVLNDSSLIESNIKSEDQNKTESKSSEAKDDKKDSSTEKKQESNKTEENTTKETVTKKDTSKNTDNTTSTEDKKEKQENNKECINLKIVDEVNGKSLLSSSVNINGSETLEEIMKRVLKERSVPSRIVNGYISMMYNLRERDAGSLSGWVFYVDGVKSSAGIAGVTPKSNQTIEWKFVKDGVNN